MVYECALPTVEYTYTEKLYIVFGVNPLKVSCHEENPAAVFVFWMDVVPVYATVDDTDRVTLKEVRALLYGGAAASDVPDGSG
jgi:hypothetical protein